MPWADARRRCLTRGWWWLLPSALAAALRLWNLPAQVLMDDEIHALRYGHAQSAGWIFTHWSGTDYGRPLALLYRAYWSLGLPVGEMDARAPGLLAGLLLVVGLPLAARRAGLAEVRGWLCWLLAFSPLLVLHSRIARTYMPATLLAQAAVWSALVWMERGGRLWAGAYVVCAALAAQWHLVAVPFVLLPLPFMAVREWLVPHERRRGWLRLAATAAATLGGLLALQLPALPSLFLVAGRRAGEGRLSWHTLSANAWLQAGSIYAIGMCLFFGLALFGAWKLRQRRAIVLWFTLTLVVGHLMTLWVLRPTGVQSPHIFARYFIVALPLVLIWVACGLARLSAMAHGRLAGTALLLLLVATGPFTRSVYWRGTLSHHVALLRFDCAPPALPLSALSRFYTELGRTSGTKTLIEFPWDATSASRAVLSFQQHHRQAVIAAPPGLEVLGSPEFRLRWLIAPTPESFLASRARYVVVHRDLPAEERLLSSNACVDRPDSTLGWAPGRGRNAKLRLAARAMEQELRTRWGAPGFADDLILAWDLDRLRS